jgi:hypothetical protein
VVFGTHLVVLIHEGVQPQLLLVLLEKGFALVVRLGGATLGGAHHRGHLDPLGAVLLDGVAINLHFLVRPVVAVHAISLHVEPPQDSAVAAGAAAHHPRRDFCRKSRQIFAKQLTRATTRSDLDFKKAVYKRPRRTTSYFDFEDNLNRLGRNRR